MRKRHVVVMVAGAAVLGVGIGAAAFYAAHPAPADTGRQACLMMQQDRNGGVAPDQARSARELSLLSRSANSDLRRAAKILVAMGLPAGYGAFDQLGHGCGAVGVRLEIDTPASPCGSPEFLPVPKMCNTRPV